MKHKPTTAPNVLLILCRLKARTKFQALALPWARTIVSTNLMCVVMFWLAINLYTQILRRAVPHCDGAIGRLPQHGQ